MEEKQIFGYVYLVKNLVNGKMYFGITENDFDTRYKHGDISNTHNDHLRSSIEKYGIENFEINKEFDVAYTEDDLWDLEDMYMCIYNTIDRRYGYNKQRSGSKHKGHGKHSEDTKHKQSEIAKELWQDEVRRQKMCGENNPMYGISPKERMDEKTYEQWLYKQKTMERCGEANPNYGHKWDDEQRERQSKIQKEIAQRDDYVNPFKGHHHTEETKKKYFYGEANPMYGRTGEKNPFYGKHHTEEVKRRNSEAHKGKPCQEETKQKLSKRMKGENNPMYGVRICGKDNHNSRKVICLETKQIFECIREAQEWLGKGSISHNLNGHTKYAGKHPETKQPLHWMYYEDYLKLQEQQSNKTQDLVTEVA